MKILQKFFLSLIIITCVFVAFLPAFSEVDASSVSSLVGKMTGDDIDDSLSADLRGTINKLLGFLQLAAGLISVIVISFTGFQYIVASTPDMKDEIKKKMLPLLIGMVLVFGAASIAKFILGAVEGSSNGGFVQL